MHMERLRRHVARCVCEKKGKVEEETLTDLKMILTSQDNLKTRWFFAFAFGIFRCTPSDNYDHMHMEGLRRHVARCMQEKGKVEEETLTDLKMSLTSKENLRTIVLCLLPLALSFAHLATTTAICTWRDCEDMSQDGMQEKRQSRRINFYRSADDSDILGQSKDQVYSSLPLPLALSVAHLATTTAICAWRDCEDMSQDGMQDKRQK